MTTSAPRLLRRFGDGLRDPWALLVSGIGAGVAWAVGIGVAEAAGIGALMLAGASGVAALRGAVGGPDVPELPRLVPGTEQARLVAALDAYLVDLRQLRSAQLPSEVTTSAIEALVAADGARDTAHRVALAIDGVERALDHTREAVDRGTREVSAGIRDSQDRMRAHHDALLAKLTAAVTEVAEVYTKLLELSVTAGSLGVGGDGLDEVEAVNASLDSLAAAFAELEADAAR